MYCVSIKRLNKDKKESYILSNSVTCLPQRKSFGFAEVQLSTYYIELHKFGELIQQSSTLLKTCPWSFKLLAVFTFIFKK
jgi:hypothetical protein